MTEMNKNKIKLTRRALSRRCGQCTLALEAKNLIKVVTTHLRQGGAGESLRGAAIDSFGVADELILP